MKQNYKNLIIANIAAIVIFGIVLGFLMLRIFTMDLLNSNSFLYWSVFKIASIAMGASLIAAILLFIFMLIFKKKNCKNVFTTLLTVLIVASVGITAGFCVNSYKSSQSIIFNSDNLPEKYTSLKYVDSDNITVKQQSNEDGTLYVAKFKGNGKEFLYYEMETESMPCLYDLLEFNFLEFPTEFNYDPNKEPYVGDTIDGFDYYIYETETSYVFEQIPSHSNSEITATALKTDGYSIYDFETDVLQIRQK